MLLLHTADLHLGKILHERDLLEDQAYMLDRLLGLLAERRPAALLIAGDLYDRAIPQPEALRLFDSFLNRAAGADPELTIVVIPGNHDSAARLSFGAGLMRRAGVHIRTRADECGQPIFVERGGVRLAIWALPFLSPSSFASGDETRPSPEGLEAGPSTALRSQSELFDEALRRITPHLIPDVPNVLVAHCFAAGGETSDSERAFLGTAEQVDSRIFEGFDYTALGHLHRPQAAGAAARYAGSPLAYSFGEAGQEKGFLLVEVKKGGFEARLVPLKPLRVVRRIEGPFSRLAAPGAFPEYREDYVEARLTDSEPVLNPADPLRANFPNLLSVRQAAFELAAPGVGGAGEVGRDAGGAGSVAQDFAAFYAEMKGASPDAGTIDLFAELIEEAEHETL